MTLDFFFFLIKGNVDKQQLQDDIDKLIMWSEKWQILFNFERCKCLHAGHGNTDAKIGESNISLSRY